MDPPPAGGEPSASSRAKTGNSYARALEEKGRLTDIEKEEERDMREGSFEKIIMKLEKKGQKNNIYKYKEMQ